jgi:hypothetical protein
MDTIQQISAFDCKTKKDIHTFIIEQLNPIENAIEEIIDNESWIITHGFRRSFFYHNVFFNKKTQEYAFHVSDGDLYECRHDDFPNFGRYNKYKEMIDAVVDKYAILWKIDA